MTSTTKKYTEQQEQIATFANALGHPVRVAILELLASQSCCYHGDLSDELPIANPPKTKYCINRQNYAVASEIFASFFANSLDTEFTKDGILLCS